MRNHKGWDVKAWLEKGLSESEFNLILENYICQNLYVIKLWWFKKQGQTEYLRNHQLPNPRTYVSSRGYSFAKGQTG